MIGKDEITEIMAGMRTDELIESVRSLIGALVWAVDEIEARIQDAEAKREEG